MSRCASAMAQVETLHCAFLQAKPRLQGAMVGLNCCASAYHMSCHSFALLIDIELRHQHDGLPHGPFQRPLGAAWPGPAC